ncbi:hypothetical protein GGF37_006674, partial [Kickxella alabastrina]
LPSRTPVEVRSGRQPRVCTRPGCAAHAPHTHEDGRLRPVMELKPPVPRFFRRKAEESPTGAATGSGTGTGAGAGAGSARREAARMNIMPYRTPTAGGRPGTINAAGAAAGSNVTGVTGAAAGAALRRSHQQTALSRSNSAADAKDIFK